MLLRHQRIWQAIRNSSRVFKTRHLSSLPETVESSQAVSEHVKLSNSSPILLRLQERAWGATSVLPASAVPVGAEPPERVGVVRDAFAAADEPPRPLSALVASLGGRGVAIAATISQPDGRLIVDEYSRAPGGSYELTAVGTDLLRLLRREGLRIAHVPDVGVATHNSMRSVSGSGPRQSTNEVLMVAPTAFEFNEQTAQDNSFMHSDAGGRENCGGIAHTVLQEFAGLYRELSEVQLHEEAYYQVAGVKVNLFQHSHSHGTPDAVFPNNWFSTHPAGEAAGGTKESTLVFYPMKCPNRAMERRLDMQSVLRSRCFSKVIDLSAAEQNGRSFEGTGVLVLDRINGIAYVALSERADFEVASHWVEQLGYKELVTFNSSDTQGRPVYHTNVLMAIGTDVAVACLESVVDSKERQHLRSRLSKHHEVVEISPKQMAALCGNVLELEDGRGLPVLAMSSQAYHAFTPEQRRVLRRHVAELHHAPIDTLEHVGGGGVRCALGEVFT